MLVLFQEFVKTVMYVIKHTRTEGCVYPNVMCWGGNNFQYYHNPDFTLEFVQFRVTGLKFRGIVRIIIDRGLDLFNIQLIRVQKKDVVYSIDGIYIDQLVEVIDDLVETKGFKK